MTPVEPPKKAIGTKTADNTSAMPTNAPVIWFIDFMVASLGESPSSAIRRSTFSTTTMASSTKSPMARTIPNMVSVLIEKPASESTANVPSRITGTAMVGISVARMFYQTLLLERYVWWQLKTALAFHFGSQSKRIITYVRPLSSDNPGRRARQALPHSDPKADRFTHQLQYRP